MSTETSRRLFDAAALKRQCPGLADPRLHYLDSAATAQMPDLVLNALRRFEVEARANVHEGMHARARAATEAYNRARACIARFLKDAVGRPETTVGHLHDPRLRVGRGGARLLLARLFGRWFPASLDNPGDPPTA
jgi:Aminotransferase class-V